VRNKAARMCRRGIPGGRERFQNRMFSLASPIERHKLQEQARMQVNL
jgi:hypothetical protein